MPLFLLSCSPFSQLSCFLLHVTCTLLLPSQATQPSLYVFLDFAFHPRGILPYEDPEPGTTDERGHDMFVFLSLGYLTQETSLGLSIDFIYTGSSDQL